MSVFVVGLTGLTHLDLFGARITDSGTNHLRSKLHGLLDTLIFCFLKLFCWFSFDTDLKRLQSLEICGGGLTDAGVKNIKDLSSLTLLNLSQNSNLTDKTLELISGKIQKWSFLEFIRQVHIYLKPEPMISFKTRRADRIGLSKRLKLSSIKLRTASPEAIEEPEISDLGVLQGLC